MRARRVAVGVDAVRAAAQRNRVELAIMAEDASRNSRDKLEPLLRARGVTLSVGPEAQLLGESVGRGAVAAIGILDRNLAAGIRKLRHGRAVAPEQGDKG
jgi:ribosomal protein L7Ae-like RNA K-turn-binding protein